MNESILHVSQYSVTFVKNLDYNIRRKRQSLVQMVRSPLVKLINYQIN